MKSLAGFLMYSPARSLLLVFSAILIFASTGCVDEYESKISSSYFFESLHENGIRPSPVPRNSDMGLSSLPEESSIGFYELNRTNFALYSVPGGFDLETMLSDLNQSEYAVHQNYNLLLVCNRKIEPKVIKIFNSVSPPLNYRQAGWFIYPLGFCLFLSLFVSAERIYSLRRGLTFPLKVEKALIRGEFPDKKWKKRSAAERIVQVATKEDASPDALRAYSRLEISSMSRGMFLLEVVVSGAPLIGLLGTVSGLVKVFSAIPELNSAQGSAFSEGIALALLTTIIGLSIAIPTLFLHSWLGRVIETRASSLDWLTERLVEASGKSESDSHNLNFKEKEI